MVVVCVNNNDLIVGPTQSLLTVGKSYELIKVIKRDGFESMYVVVDDTGQKRIIDVIGSFRSYKSDLRN